MQLPVFQSGKKSGKIPLGIPLYHCGYSVCPVGGSIFYSGEYSHSSRRRLGVSDWQVERLVPLESYPCVCSKSMETPSRWKPLGLGLNSAS
ncbi:hypothetical protein BDW59DRAFT_149035 [Aspergillus cavernicola]|uniref:Uncharacterized protein n=1 Tax=Aspergillus cavernicola TaxID=176166 RepID=A0ABR4I689_9EURO